MRAAVRPHHLSGGEQVGEIIEVELTRRLEHRGFDHPALARGVTFIQRRENAECSVEAGHGISDGGADHTRMLGIDQQRQKTRCGLRNGVECLAVTIRPLAAETRDRSIYQRRIDGVQPRRIDIEPPRHARAEVLYEDVSGFDQLIKHRKIVGVLGINGDRTLVAVIGLEMRAVELALEVAERIAGDRLFVLDDIRPEIGKPHPGDRPGDESARIQETGGPIPNSVLIDMFRLLKGRDDGFRVTPGTALKHDRTGAIVYVPPQDARDVVAQMTALERFVNDDTLSGLDPLIKMALIHHQFESIHPFPDGNGRIGRILNVLYLTRTGLLDIPVVYLSRHVTRHKADYYRLLQAVRDSGGSQEAWEAWVIYMLEGVAETAATMLRIVEGIRDQMARAKYRMRTELPRLYRRELLNNLFRHPYTRIEYVQRDLGLKARQTAEKYLDALVEQGFVVKQRAGKHNYYINTELVRLFLEVSEGW